MSSTTVIAFKPFITKHPQLWGVKEAISTLVNGGYIEPGLPEGYTTVVEAPNKPHLFRRLYSQVLDRTACSVRLPVALVEQLKGIAGWQDKLRRLVATITNTVEEVFQERHATIDDFKNLRNSIVEEYSRKMRGRRDYDDLVECAKVIVDDQVKKLYKDFCMNGNEFCPHWLAYMVQEKREAVREDGPTDLTRLQAIMIRQYEAFGIAWGFDTREFDVFGEVNRH